MIVVAKKRKARYRVQTRQKKAEIELKEKLTKEEKFYWIRTAGGAFFALIGVLIFRLLGWWIFLYGVLTIFIFPFIISFLILKLPYKKKVWDWKNIIKTGLGGNFFIFMLISTIVHTLIYYTDYNDSLKYPASVITFVVLLIPNSSFIAFSLLTIGLI